MEKWEWAWLAGIFEGEGCIMFSDTAGVRLRIGMTDQDVIQTVNRLCPSARGIHLREFTHKKTQYIWERNDRDDVRTFLTGVQPYMHARRLMKLEAALERLKLNRGAKPKRTHCPKGHPLSGENLYIARTTGSRSCLACRKARSREPRVRKR